MSDTEEIETCRAVDMIVSGDDGRATLYTSRLINALYGWWSEVKPLKNKKYWREVSFNDLYGVNNTPGTLWLQRDGKSYQESLEAYVAAYRADPHDWLHDYAGCFEMLVPMMTPDHYLGIAAVHYLHLPGTIYTVNGGSASRDIRHSIVSAFLAVFKCTCPEDYTGVTGKGLDEPRLVRNTHHMAACPMFHHGMTDAQLKGEDV